MVPGGRSPGGGDPLARHPICMGHWPNVRLHTLAQRPDARRLFSCAAPRGSERAAHWNDLREDRWRPRRRAREAASAWSPESVARAAVTHSHTTPALCKAPRRWRRVRDRSHSPNARSRTLARRPDAPRLTTCTTPGGSECTATSRTAPERQRARGPTPRPTSRAWHPCGARPLRGLPQCGHDSPQGVVP